MISKFFLAIVIIYILYALFLAKEKFHLLLIPFILDSNFWGFYDLPFGEKNSDIIFFSIVFLWIFLLTFKQKILWAKLLNTYKIVLISFFTLLVIILFVSIIQYGEALPSLMVFRRLFRFISIVLLISAVSRFSGEELNKFAQVIEYFTVALSFLYILNSGLGIKVFQAENYGEYDYGGAKIYRNFAALPYFLMFSLIHVTIKEKKGFYEIIAIVLFLTTLFLSYTRSLIVAGVLFTILAFFIRALIHSKSFTRIIKFIVFVPIIMALMMATFTKVFPSQTRFLLTRINNINNANTALRDHNVDLRSKIIRSRINKTIEINPITGLGFIHEESSSNYYHDLFIRKGDKRGQVIVGDQSWGNLIALIGFLGVTIYLIMLLYPIFFLIKKGVFLKQSILCITSSFTLLGIVFINSFFDTILIKGVYLISLLISLIVVSFNNFLMEQFDLTEKEIS